MLTENGRRRKRCEVNDRDSRSGDGGSDPDRQLMRTLIAVGIALLLTQIVLNWLGAPNE